MASTKFIVVGIQRAGTTLVRTSLDSHPKARCIGEVFKISLSRGSYQGELGYDAYRSRSLLRRARHVLLRSGLTREYLDQLFALPDYDAVGFKLMYGQSLYFPAVVPYVFDNGVRIVHVERLNVLKTYVSRLVARERKQWHSEQRVPAHKITVPCHNLLERLDDISRQQQNWTDIFADRAAYLRVIYEDFVSQREEQSARLVEFLGLSPGPLESPLVKLNPDSLAQLIENLDQVRSCLEGSTYAAHLG